MRHIHAALICCLVACSSSSSSSAPTTCSRSDRSGVYRLTFTEESGGTCGPLPSTLIDFNAPGDGSCKTNSDTWSDSDCKYSADLTCALMDGRTLHETEVTTETAGGGASLSGTLSAQIQGPNGCASTYELTAVRQ